MECVAGARYEGALVWYWLLAAGFPKWGGGMGAVGQSLGHRKRQLDGCRAFSGPPDWPHLRREGLLKFHLPRLWDDRTVQAIWLAGLTWRLSMFEVVINWIGNWNTFSAWFNWFRLSCCLRGRGSAKRLVWDDPYARRLGLLAWKVIDETTIATVVMRPVLVAWSATVGKSRWVRL